MPDKAAKSPLDEVRKLLDTRTPPELGPGPRTGVLPLGELNQRLDECLRRSGLPEVVHQPVRAAVLLWHDHLDASHSIAQDLPGYDGSYLHGIMHRREPDYSNAKYWFHKVGKHPCFTSLASSVGERDDLRSLSAKLISRGEWDPFAFIDLCELAAEKSGSDSETHLLCGIQALEFELLLKKFCGGAQA